MNKINTENEIQQTEKMEALCLPAKQENQKINSESKTVRQKLRYYWSDFCNNTSIHGFQYFNQKRMFVEGLFWALLLLLAMSCCIFMIYTVILKWIQTPVIVSFATLKQPIFKVPFPAVSICPMNKYDKKSFSLDEFAKIYKNEVCKNYNNKSEDLERLSGEDNNCTNYKEQLKKAEMAEILCDVTKQSFKVNDHLSAEELTSFIQSHKVKLGLSYSTVLGHDLNLEREDFSKHFKETYTEFGVCYTYNRFRLDEIYNPDFVTHHEVTGEFSPDSEWDADTGYRSRAGINAYPRRALQMDVSYYNLQVVIIEEGDNYDPLCNQHEQGYVVSLHYPNRLPMKKDEFFFLPLNKQILISIKAAKIQTSETIMQYPPEKRDCYFSFEKNLKYFRHYTLRNCQLECLTIATLEHCKCVEYFMPRNNETKICGSMQRSCVRNLKVEIESRKMNLTGEDQNTLPGDVCHCLPLCTDVTYESQIQTLVSRNPIFNTEHLDKNQSSHLSIAMFRITDGLMVTTERNVLYGPTDLIANIGGLLSLFTGFSIISFVEIIYYMSLRLIGNILKHGHWTGQTPVTAGEG